MFAIDVLRQSNLVADVEQSDRSSIHTQEFSKTASERRIDKKSGLIPTGYSYGLNFSAALLWFGIGTAMLTTACLSLVAVITPLVTAPQKSVSYESRILVQKSEPVGNDAGLSQEPDNASGRDASTTNRSEQASQVQTHIDIADTAFGKRDFDLMEKHVNAALEMAPDNSTALFYHAIVLRERSELEKALSTLEKVVDLAPEIAANWSYFGLVNLQLKRFEATVEACDKALQIDPNLANVKLNRGQARLELGDAASAFADAEQALKMEGVDRKVALRLAGMSLVRLERPTDALPYFKRER